MSSIWCVFLLKHEVTSIIQRSLCSKTCFFVFFFCSIYCNQIAATHPLFIWDHTGVFCVWTNGVPIEPSMQEDFGGFGPVGCVRGKGWFTWKTAVADHVHQLYPLKKTSLSSCPPQKIGYIFLCFPRHGIVYKSMVFKSVHLFVRHVSHILPTSYALLWQFDACTALVYLAVFFWSSPWFLERHSFQTFLTIGTYRYRFLFRIDSYKAGYSFGAKWAQWVRGTLKFSWS